MTQDFRIGIDLGGTKIEIAALDRTGREVLRRRVPTPPDYDSALAAITALVRGAESELGVRAPVGVAIPGMTSRATGLVKNANSTWLIGRALDADLGRALGRTVRLANDANCFALSEASDGAGADAETVFGVIAGTGIGGGIVMRGQVWKGWHGIAGEWGHNPLPWASVAEIEAAPRCYCGKRGCIETWISGPGLARDFTVATGYKRLPEEIAAGPDPDAQAAMERFFDRFARALASVVNILDPDVIVLGGGISNIEALYAELPERVAAYAFTPEQPIRIVKNRHGDSSGVRGAAWLWPFGSADEALASPGTRR